MQRFQLPRVAVIVTASAVILTCTQSVRAAEEVVEYRLTEWKTLHFHDAQKGNQHMETLKKLGCEVKQGKHGGHIDVSYRCKDWKKMTVANHDLAHKWEDWLKASGFETKHAH
jgi:hypothetical protein